jgi:hypothetical protein
MGFMNTAAGRVGYSDGLARLPLCPDHRSKDETKFGRRSGS